MTRIIICFFLLTSVFIPPARAEGLNNLSAQDSELTGAEKPAIMNPDQKNYPQLVPQENVKTGPGQSEEMALPPANMRHMGRIGPAQSPFGISTHFSNPEESTPEKETPKEIPGPPAPTKGDFAELRQMDTTTADQVIDPLRIHLKDGRIVQLAGIDIPDLDPYEPGDFSAAARDLLDGLLKGKQVRLYQTRNQKEGRTNRLGYPLVHLTLSGADAAWAQGTLLSAGLARVRPSARNPEMAAQMIALEDRARKNKKGIWNDLRYVALTPDTAATGLNGWALVEGNIHSVATVGNIIYLNFGSDWRSDFTIALSAGIRSQFIKDGADPMKLGGVRVRARGWLRDYNGPYMELLHPAWMQVLTEDALNTKTDSIKENSQ